MPVRTAHFINFIRDVIIPDGIRLLLYVIVDCTSLLTGNVLATTALEVADDVLRVCSCDLKAISYFSS